jgi:hypothetical protein
MVLSPGALSGASPLFIMPNLDFTSQFCLMYFVKIKQGMQRGTS